MTIERIQAFKTSDGRCFVGKRQAYNEEIIALYRRLPTAPKEASFTLPMLDRLIRQVEGWLGDTKQVAESLRSLGPEAKRPWEMRAFPAVLTDMEKWLREAKALAKQCREDPDTQIKAALGG